MKATYTKLKSGDWGIRILDYNPYDPPASGMNVTVTKKSGESSLETVKRVLWKGDDRKTGKKVALCAIKPRQQRRPKRQRGVFTTCGGICPVGGFRCSTRRPCHDCL